MALLDDIETRLDQYGVGRTVGSQTTSTGMADAFNSSGGSPALTNHLSDDSAGWSSQVSTALFLVSTADNRAGLQVSTSTGTQYWGVTSTDTITDYATVYVDVYRPDEVLFAPATGGSIVQPWNTAMGLAIWIANPASTQGPQSEYEGTFNSGPQGALLALYREGSSDSTSNTMSLLFIQHSNGYSTATATALTTGLTVATSSGYRIGVDLAGLTVRPWREPLGGATGSRTEYAIQYLSSDPRSTGRRRHGIVGRVYSTDTTIAGPRWDNFRIQPYSSDSKADWVLSKSRMPADWEKVVTIYETGGAPAEAKAPVNYPTFQVRVRAGTTQYSTAREMVAAAETALHGASQLTLNSWYYPGIWAQSDVLPIGFDDQDTRPVLAQNYRAARSRTS